MTKQKLWGGRFTKQTNAAVDDFHSSIRFDQRYYAQDIAGSIAHATMLAKQNIIPASDADAIVAGLQSILQDIKAGKVAFDVSAEDIHMNMEKLLIERIGEAGKRLHTARSRNDQVALDSHMYVKQMTLEVKSSLIQLVEVLLEIAKQHMDTVMPGYTHLQKAQPVTLAFHVMAYCEMFKRDIIRMDQVHAMSDVMPLGAGALAGSTYNLDRQFTAEQLGFSQITMNAMDAVSDRDFMLDFIYAASVIMMHLSRFCEEVILWASSEFGFITLDDAYSTGSSIMPQKKNPDVAELIRGKTGRVYGDLMALLTTMKGLPLAYNKDMQEDKEALFDAVDTVQSCLYMFKEMIRTAVFNGDVMCEGADGGYTNATDVADYLAKKGVPFRTAHEIVGKLVLQSIQRGAALKDVSLADYQKLSPVFNEDIYEAIDTRTCVAKRNVIGGPAPESVQQMIDQMQVFIQS